MKMAKKFKIILVLFIVIIFSVIAARYAIGLHFKQKFSKRPPPGVITTTVNESIFYKSIETFGTVIALNSKNYRIKNDDIEGNFTREGKFVKKGDVIIELKSTEKIIADFSGKLGMREIAQGVLGSDSIIITLDDLQKVIIDIKVPENYVGVLKKGLRAEVFSSTLNKKFKGKIQSVSSRIDPSTRSILARVIVDNNNYEIIPGQLMNVKIIYDEKKGLGVPERAVTVQGNTAFVYVVKDEVVKKQFIEIGTRNYGKVSVTSGVSKGDIIVSEGVSKIRDNTKIKIIR